MNKELKEYLYMLVGKELTYQDKEKILNYFNELKQEKDKFNKRNEKLKERISDYYLYVKILENRIEILSNIINKLEKMLEEGMNYSDYYEGDLEDIYEEIYNHLQELKEMIDNG